MPYLQVLRLAYDFSGTQASIEATLVVGQLGPLKHGEVVWRVLAAATPAAPEVEAASRGDQDVPPAPRPSVLAAPGLAASHTGWRLGVLEDGSLARLQGCLHVFHSDSIALCEGPGGPAAPRVVYSRLRFADLCSVN